MTDHVCKQCHDHRFLESTREKCRQLHSKLGRDAILRQNDPVQTIMNFAMEMFAAGYYEGFSDGIEPDTTTPANKTVDGE